jgi:hypothetical protein
MNYKLIRESHRDHHFWREQETNRIVVGDHSGDDRSDQPTHPANCEDGILYVIPNTIIDSGKRYDILRCRVIAARDGKEYSVLLGDDEARWLAAQQFSSPITYVSHQPKGQPISVSRFLVECDEQDRKRKEAK